MQRLGYLTLIFAVLLAVFTLCPPFLSQQCGLYPLLKAGDVFDLLTPLVLIPLYWLLFQISRDRPFSQGEMILFLVLSALWVLGQGMHLAANAIGHLTEEMAGSDLYTLTYFLDEILSHYLWHSGLVGLSALLIYRQWKYPFTGERSKLVAEISGGIIYGLTYFMMIVEGGTAPLGIPFAALVVLFTLIWGRKGLRQQPILAFFFTGYLVATLLFLIWGIYWGGLPEFSEVGIID